MATHPQASSILDLNTFAKYLKALRIERYLNTKASKSAKD